MKSILLWVMELLMGCRHPHRTTPRYNSLLGVYEACLDCGRELPYSNEQLIGEVL